MTISSEPWWSRLLLASQFISFIYPSSCCLVTQWQRRHLLTCAACLLWSSLMCVCAPWSQGECYLCTRGLAEFLHMPFIVAGFIMSKGERTLSYRLVHWQGFCQGGAGVGGVWVWLVEALQVFEQSIQSLETNWGINSVTWLTDRTPVPRAFRWELRHR